MLLTQLDMHLVLDMLLWSVRFATEALGLVSEVLDNNFANGALARCLWLFLRAISECEELRSNLWEHSAREDILVALYYVGKFGAILVKLRLD